MAAMPCEHSVHSLSQQGVLNAATIAEHIRKIAEQQMLGRPSPLSPVGRPSPLSPVGRPCKVTNRYLTSLQKVSCSSCGISTNLFSKEPLKGMMGSPPWFFTQSNTCTRTKSKLESRVPVALLGASATWEAGQHSILHGACS